MKSRIFYLVLPVLFSFFCLPMVSGQIGIRGGPSISDIVFAKDGQTPYLSYEINSLEHRKPLFTFQVGAFTTFDLNQRLAFQPELLFVMQGLDYSTQYLYDDISYKIKTSYMQMPLLLRYKTSLKNNRGSGPFIGPYVSRKLNAVRLTEVEGQREKTTMSTVRGGDLGLVGGYSFEIGHPDHDVWIVDLRFNFSLVNIMDRVDGYLRWYYGPEKAYVRNISIALTVGYQFSNSWPKKLKNHENE